MITIKTLKRSSSYFEFLRELLAGVKQHRRFSELALELHVERLVGIAGIDRYIKEDMLVSY